jgi:cytochrome c biogenesis protein CcmG, thiol:disulfide interchange protein DsbE
LLFTEGGKIFNPTVSFPSKNNQFQIIMKKNLLFAFLLFSVSAFSQKALPNVDIKTLEGKTINSQTLSQKGKVTVVSFWATWCGPCKKEMDVISPKYSDWQQKYNMELIAISIDNAQGLPKVKPMVAQKGWKYKVLSDVNSQLLQNVGGQSVPYTVLLDKNGNIVYTHNGFISGDEIELEKKIEQYSKM